MNLIPNPQPVTFRKALARGFASAFLLTGLLVLAVYVPSMHYEPPSSASGSAMTGKPNAVGSPEWLTEQHDCWTANEAAPADVTIPGHVIARTETGEWKRGGTKMVDAAFGQLFDGEDNGLVIHAFCR